MFKYNLLSDVLTTALQLIYTNKYFLEYLIISKNNDEMKTEYYIESNERVSTFMEQSLDLYIMFDIKRFSETIKIIITGKF